MTTIRILALSARTASLLLTPHDALYKLQTPVKWRLETQNSGLVYEGTAQSVGIFIEDLEPDTTYKFRCDLGELDFTTKQCAGLIEAADFGVDASAADNSEAFAKAIASVPNGGTLHVHSGQHITRPIFLKANMTLLLSKGATISGLGDRSNWPILPAHDDKNRVIGTWEGLPDACFAAVVTGIDCHNLIITGRGTIDGGGDRGDWWSWPKETRSGARRPRTLHIAYSQDVVLSGITVRNSPSWTIHPYRSDGLHVSNLTIYNPSDSPNTDGLNPESCQGVEITATAFSVGDDCIAIKSGKRGPNQIAHLWPTKNVAINHCLMERGHGAVVLGSEMSGSITDVRISNCEFNQTDRGLRLKTRRGRGGCLSDISMTDVAMQDVATPLAINAFYFCDADGKSDFVQSREFGKIDETTPTIKNITCNRITAHGVTAAAAAVLGLPESPIENVKLTEFNVSFNPDAEPEEPLMALGVPTMKHNELYSEFAIIDGTAALNTPQEA